MARNLRVGIDVGTYHVKVVVAEHGNDRNLPRIIATGYAESKGMRHGYIVNPTDVTRSIRDALAQAESQAQIKIRKVYLGVGGVSLEGTTGQGTVIISRGDQEITDLDIKKAQEDCEQRLPQAATLNRKILHAIPLGYRIDGKEVLGRPGGLRGVKLDVRMLFITCLEQHLNDLISAVEDSSVEVEDVMASPLAASFVTLTKAQKIAGCVLANIGSETVSIVVFENNIPISLEVFPIGSTDITHDIALGLKIPLEEAEELKMGGIISAPYSRKKLDEIVSARLTDIFELIEAHLKKIGRNGLLPAGIIITGGGAGLTSVDELAKALLRLPSKLATLSQMPSTKIKDAAWAVAYGLCIFGFTSDLRDRGGISFMETAKRGVLSWIKQFLP